MTPAPALVILAINFPHLSLTTSWEVIDVIEVSLNVAPNFVWLGFSKMIHSAKYLPHRSKGQHNTIAAYLVSASFRPILLCTNFYEGPQRLVLKSLKSFDVSKVRSS